MANAIQITPAVRDLVWQGWLHVKRNLRWAMSKQLILDEAASIPQIRDAGLSKGRKQLQNAKGRFEPHTMGNAIDSLMSMPAEQVRSVLEEMLRSDETDQTSSDTSSSIAALEAL